MINMLALALISMNLNIGMTELPNSYIIPCNLSVSYTTSFNTTRVVSALNYDMDYAINIDFDCDLICNKAVLPDGTFAFGARFKNATYTAYANDYRTGNQTQIFTDTKAMGNYTIPFENIETSFLFEEHYIVTGSYLTWRGNVYSTAYDDDIVSFNMNVSQIMTTNRSNPTNLYVHYISGDSVYYQALNILQNYVDVDYQAGYSTGFKEGEKVGIIEGQDNMANEISKAEDIAYTNGYNYGYNEGVQAGGHKGITLQKLFWSVIDEPFAVIYRLLDFEVLGVNVFAFLSGLVTLGLIGFVIKMII